MFISLRKQSPYIFQRIQKFLLFNLKMTVDRSKRRCFLTLTFLVKSVSKNLLNQNFNCFYVKSTISKVIRCRRSLFCWLSHHVLTWQQIQVFCIHNILKMKRTSAKKHTEHCLTHLLVNKTACIHFWLNCPGAWAMPYIRTEWLSPLGFVE